MWARAQCAVSKLHGEAAKPLAVAVRLKASGGNGTQPTKSAVIVFAMEEYTVCAPAAPWRPYIYGPHTSSCPPLEIIPPPGRSQRDSIFACCSPAAHLPISCPVPPSFALAHSLGSPCVLTNDPLPRLPSPPFARRPSPLPAPPCPCPSTLALSPPLSCPLPPSPSRTPSLLHVHLFVSLSRDLPRCFSCCALPTALPTVFPTA